MRISRCNERYAFSLVEVIVALGVLMFGILGMLELFDSSRNVARQSLMRARALATAREVAQDWRAAGPKALADIYFQDGSTTPTQVLIPRTPAPLEAALGNEPGRPNPEAAAWQARLTPIPGHPDLVQVQIAVGWGTDAAADPLAALPGASVQLVEWFPLRPQPPAAPSTPTSP